MRAAPARISPTRCLPTRSEGPLLRQLPVCRRGSSGAAHPKLSVHQLRLHPCRSRCLRAPRDRIPQLYLPAHDAGRLRAGVLLPAGQHGQRLPAATVDAARGRPEPHRAESPTSRPRPEPSIREVCLRPGAASRYGRTGAASGSSRSMPAATRSTVSSAITTSCNTRATDRHERRP